jgi:flagellin
VGANAFITENSIKITGVFGDTTTAAVAGGATIRNTTAFDSATNAAAYINTIDTAINTISTKKSTIGAMVNRLDSAEQSFTTTIENATAAKSTIMDADIAEESMNYTKAQILQQTSAALLVQANALPQIAINLVQG